MAIQDVSDAVVVPEDPGTGLAEPDDPVSAAAIALISQHVGGEYVLSDYSEGMGFVSRSASNDTITIGKGACYIEDTSDSTTGSRGGGGNARIQSLDDGSDPPSYNTEIPDNQHYLVLFPSQVTIDVSDSTSNQIWVNIPQIGINNSVEVRSDGGGGTTSAPSDTYIKLGEANPDDASQDTRVNDYPAISTRLLTTYGDIDDDQNNTIYDYSNQRIGSGLVDSTSADLGSGLADDSGSIGLDIAANGDATLSSGSVTVDTGVSVNDTDGYSLYYNPDDGADLAASLEEGGTNYQLHLEETDSTSVGNPGCKWWLVRLQP